MNNIKHLDITVDIETLALTSNAAILQIAAVPWLRHAPESPFFPSIKPFVGHVDLRSCIKDNFDIDPCTMRWWASQPEELKASVLTAPCSPLEEILDAFADWIKEVKAEVGAETVCLWALGSDFDIANLRTAFSRYNLDLPVDYRYFRDARTFILEVGRHFMHMDAAPQQIENLNEVYDHLPPMPDEQGLKHDALHDARRTSWHVWSILKKMTQAA